MAPCCHSQRRPSWTTVTTTSTFFIFPFLLLLQQLLLLLSCTRIAHAAAAAAAGGEKASFHTAPYTVNVTHRQNFCTRYNEAISSNTALQMKDALNGAAIRPVLQYGEGFPYFRYSAETGIDPADPGLVANILDYIGAPEHANFTWRSSFAVYTAQDKGDDRSWTDMLKWTVDTYDIAIDKWAKSTDRLNKGIAFCDRWFDAGIVMVDKMEPVEDSRKPKFGNWLRPFDAAVWWTTIGTILLSCAVYQFLEHCADDRRGRSAGRWFSDNLYLAAINFTQNYSYEPPSLAAKLFGVSFAFWAMLIGATYTANLASLLVVRTRPFEITDIEQGINHGMSFCTFQAAFSDEYVKRWYPNADRRPQPTPDQQYDALNNKQCDIVLGGKQTWLTYQSIERHNPDCDLKWVGRPVQSVDASFATKVDPGNLCTGLVNEVFNYYFSKMRDEGILDELWNEFNSKQATPGHCQDGGGGGDGTDGRRVRRNLLPTTRMTTTKTMTVDDSSSSSSTMYRRQRVLGKGGGNTGNPAAAAATAAASGGDDDDDEEESLTIQQMAGVFLVHAIGCAIAILVALIRRYCLSNNNHSCLNGKNNNTEGGSSNTSSADNQRGQLEKMQASQMELSIQLHAMMSALQRIEHRLPADDEQDNDSYTTAKIHTTTEKKSRISELFSSYFRGSTTAATASEITADKL